MRRPKTRLVLGISLPLLVIVVLLAAWAIDSSGTNGKVPRNVTLAGRDISKFGEDDLAATVADVDEEYAATKVEVRTPDRTYKVASADLGLNLDEAATTQGALTLDEDRPFYAKPFVWLSSFLDERQAPLEFTLDETQLDAGLVEMADNAAPVEPSVVATGDGFGIVSGSSGTQIGTEGVGEQLVDRASSGDLPIVVSAEVVEQPPTVSDEAAKALADQMTVNTENGLAVTAGTASATLPTATVRSWLGSEITDGEIVDTLDAEKAMVDLTAALPDATTTKDASIALVNGAIQITPSVEGTKCCAADTPARLLAAINGGTGKVEIALETDKPGFTTEDAEKLGIKEPVGTTTEWNGQPQVKSFTTYHPCCAARVTNIQRIADLVNGTVIKPGEKFSMNDVVGQRTKEKGFVEAGAIANGEHVDEVGGGVSQFATTMFNAAFFAGLPINTYQAHSEYFSRYPYGREATMGFPNPNLVWTNDTPYGILVATSHTDTSVTVTLWSTQYAYGQQTGQSEGRSGNCTTVSTQRTITYPDGRTATDSFNARYRDDGATTC